MKLPVILGAVLGTFLQLMAVTPAHALTVVHSNDVLGEIEPCGCRTNPLGGYARKANFLKGLKDPELLQLDAGDLLFASDRLPEVLKAQSVQQAKWIMKILDQTHLDAVTPGEKDFALGVKAFREIVKGSPVQFLAANLRDHAGKTVLPASAIFNRKGSDGKPVRIAVLGVVGNDFPWPDNLKASDPLASAKALVPELRKKAKYVILLSHAGLEADKKIAKAVPGIDLIIGGHTQSFLQTPLKVGSTIIYQSSFRNQYVGAIDLEKISVEDSYRLIGLDTGYESPSEMPGAVDDSVKKFKAAIAEANSQEMPVAISDSEHTHFQTFPRCAECHLKQFNFWRTTAHANALVPLVKAGQDKNKECLQCHSVGLGDSKGFSHVTEMIELTSDGDKPMFLSNEKFADYLASIHEAKRLSDPARGLSSDPAAPPVSSPVSIDQSLGKLKRAWTPVQCENCHGPGENHPMSGNYPKAVDSKVCLSCHTPTRAPEWYRADGQPDWDKIKAKHAMISCPAGEMTSDQ